MYMSMDMYMYMYMYISYFPIHKITEPAALTRSIAVHMYVYGGVVGPTALCWRENLCVCTWIGGFESCVETFGTALAKLFLQLNLNSDGNTITSAC